MRHRPWLVLAAGLAAGGCITGFKQPLGPVSQSFVEPSLLGGWTCTDEDDPGRVKLTFTNFDGRQYYVQSEDLMSDVQGHRAIATRLEGSSFLSLRTIVPKDGEEWTVLEYSFPARDHLAIRLVDPEPFGSLRDDPQAVRDLLSARLQDPEIIAGLMSCTRAESGRSNELQDPPS